MLRCCCFTAQGYIFAHLAWFGVVRKDGCFCSLAAELCSLRHLTLADTTSTYHWHHWLSPPLFVVVSKPGILAGEGCWGHHRAPRDTRGRSCRHTLVKHSQTCFSRMALQLLRRKRVWSTRRHTSHTARDQLSMAYHDRQQGHVQYPCVTYSRWRFEPRLEKKTDWKVSHKTRHWFSAAGAPLQNDAFLLSIFHFPLAFSFMRQLAGIEQSAIGFPIRPRGSKSVWAV